MVKEKHIFKWVYLAYFLVLVVLVTSATLYVRGLLQDYEAAQPERQVESAFNQLLADAASPEGFWNKYGLPAVTGGTYEAGIDVQKAYLALYAGELDYVQKTGSYGEDELCYLIRRDNFPLAEVMLKAKGPAYTKLAVFSMRDWELASVKPLLEQREYTLSLPENFTVSANGVALSQGTATDDGKVKYTVSGVYLEPTFAIADAGGQKASYVVKNFRVLPELYDYTLTLPASLTVTVNGVPHDGQMLSNGRIRHTIMLLQKPTVTISDLYGNSLQYEGGDLPLTYMTITAPDTYTVTLNGNKVPDGAVTKSIPAEYDILKDLVPDLPQQAVYDIAILQKNAAVALLDADGKTVKLEEGKTQHTFSHAQVLEAVPQEVSSQVDVLLVAQNWSKFMSNDYSFQNMAQLMVPDSYQYQVAKKYSTSVDSKFFASHTLLDPAFTDNKVENFTWITPNSFSVDISFVKHMWLTSGRKKVDDAMNDRFYFVRYQGQWLLAGMKEVFGDDQ